MGSLKSILYSIGWQLLKQGLRWLIRSEVWVAIRAGVVSLVSSELSGEEKHAAVVEIAEQVQTKLRAELGKDTVKKLPREILQIGVKAAYLELVAPSESTESEDEDGEAEDG
jgi:hypothetical protein